ncbi:MAG: hypothetical protein WD069_22880 [Planctomycetales bacterium]
MNSKSASAVAIAWLVALGAAFPSVRGEEVARPQEAPQPPLAPYTGPTVAAPATALSVVVLPPRIEGEANPATLTAAEAACDRLAQELAAGGKVQVVDRGNLVRILDERKLAGSNQPPITALSAMLRLEVSGGAAEGRTRLQVVDLATGNPLGEREFPWPLTEPDVKPMRKFCRAALAEAATATAGKRKVRLLPVNDLQGNVRLRPLAYRLENAFRESLRKSEHVVLVQHLEAASSWEESLLLSMGLARLPGGKQFAPQADAAIELKLEERDAVGKTFDQTTVVLGVGLHDGGGGEIDWSESTAKVRDFDQLIVRAWESTAERLDAVRGISAADVLKEFATRRQQAEAELRAAKSVCPDPSSTSPPEKIAEAIEHLETAMKIDPTFAQPHFEILPYFNAQCLRTWYKAIGDKDVDANGDPEIAHIEPVALRSLQSAVTYVTHPDCDPAMKDRAYVWCLYSSIYTSLRGFTDTAYDEKKKTPQRTKLTRPLVDAMKVVVTQTFTSAAEDINSTSRLEGGVVIVWRGMKFTGYSNEERRAWLAELAPHADRMNQELVRKSDMEDLRRVQARIMTFAEADEPARSVAQPTGQAVASKSPSPSDKRPYIPALRINWPYTVVPGATPRSPEEPPELHVVRLDYRRSENRAIVPLSPIAVDRKYAYLLASPRASVEWGYGNRAYRSAGPYTLVMIPLDAEGRPIGKLVDVPGISPAIHREYPIRDWEGAIIPDGQPAMRSQRSVVAEARGGKLYLATDHDGLFIYDPEKDSWRVFGPEQGNPTPGITGFHFLDDRRLYCVGVQELSDRSRSRNVHFTIDLETGTVELLHRVEFGETERFSHRLVPIWKHEYKLVDGWSIDLLSEAPQRREGKSAQVFRRTNAAARIGERFFFTTERVNSAESELHEHDSEGNILRSWQDMRTTEIPFLPGGSLSRIGNAAPHSGYMVQAGEYLVFFNVGGGITLFDPQADTWHFAPLPRSQSHVMHAVGAPAGVWLVLDTGQWNAQNIAAYMTTDDLLRRAKEWGCVATSREAGTLWRKFASRRSVLVQAQIEFMLRDFDACERLLDEALAEKPDDRIAIYLLALMHDRGARNKPDVALEHYRRLTELADDSAVATGLLHSIALHRNAKRWNEVLALGEELTRRYPGLDERSLRYVRNWMAEADKNR